MMDTKDGILETGPFSEKIISGETMRISGFIGNDFRHNNDASYPNSLENLEIKGSKTKYPFIVDWQVPETNG